MRSASELVIYLLLLPAIGEGSSERELSNASRPRPETPKNRALGSLTRIEEQGEKLRRSVHLLKTSGKAEFVFLIDSSSSIGEDNYKSQIRFVRKFVADFKFGPTDVRIAVVAFASSAQTYVNHLEKAPKFGKCTFLHVELPILEKLYNGGNTDTIGALLEARRIFNESRKGAAKALFLMTDGFSNKGDPLPTAKSLRDEGVIIFTFGIQSGNAQEVRELSSGPQEDHAFILSSFSDFESLARKALHEDLKLGPYAVLDDPEPCDTHCPATVFPGATGCCNRQSRCGCGTLTGYFSCLCPPGFYGSGFRGEECRPCPNGTYHDGSTPGDVTVCTPCPDSNHVTSKIPSTSMEDCTCKEGYVSRDGECKVLTCPILKVPENGYFVNKNCSNVLHAACGVLCSTGYKLQGSSVRICQVSGKWSGSPPICIPKSCRDPKPVHGAVMTCRNADSKREILVNLDDAGNVVETYFTGQQEDLDGRDNSPQQFNFTVDTACSFKCHPGRSMIGSRTRTCLPILQWNGLSTTCSVVNCPSLPALTNGFVKPENCTVRGLRHDYAAQCSITCKSGYLLQGPSLRNCTGRRGTWTAKKIPNKCIDVEPPVFECPNNITTKAINGESYALVYLTLPEGKDNSGLEPIIWSKPPFLPDHPLPMKIGTTKVEIYGTDATDNSDLCEFHVQVKDEEMPKVFNCESPATFYLNDGALEMNWTEPLFQDNSQTPLQLEKRIVFGNFSLGTTTLIYLATDASGNTANCTLNITVAENPCSDRPLLRNVLWNCTSDSSATTCSLSCPEGLAWTTDRNVNNVSFTCLRMGNEAVWNPDMFDDLDALPECSSFQVPKKAITSQEIELSGEEVSCEDLERLSIEINLFLNSGEFDDVSMVATCLQDDFRSPADPTAATSLLDRKRRGAGSKKIGIRLSLFGFSNETRNLEILEKRVHELKLRMEQKSGGKTFAGRKVKIHRAKAVEREKLVCSTGFTLKQGLCVRCPPGTFYKLSRSDCVPCPIGEFQPFEGRLQCEPCASGYLTDRRRRTQATDCRKICSAGTFGRKKSKRQRLVLEPCTPCPVGFYQAKRGQTSCVRCPGEKTTSKRGSNREEQCRDKEELHDPCYLYPCMNNGTCSSSEGHPYCTCIEGFLGSHCEKRKNYCDSSPCYNGGECLPAETAKFVCRCPAGYQGDLCQYEMDECASLPCANGAECVDLVNGYSCECAPGFAGNNCEENIDECSLFNPCLNNGTCNDLVDGYNCTCRDGFAGDHCEEAFRHLPDEGSADEETRETANVCSALVCPKNAKCVNSPETENRPTCLCREGFYGINCTEEVNFNVILGFPRRSVTDYLSAHFPNEDLHRVSVCVWLRTSDTSNYGTLFSYAVGDDDNSFTVTDYKGLVLYVRNQRVVTDLAVNDGRWHFVCVTWQSDEGRWTLYLDGENRANGTGLAAGSPVPGGGTFVIGQEQDRPGGGFNEIESFVGKITHFDVWKKILRKSEIEDMKENCKYFQGDLIGWTKFLENIHGNVERTKSSFCTNCDARDLRLFAGRTSVRNIGDSIFAVYECDRGFRLAFEDDAVAEDAKIWYRKCLKHGYWESTVPKCIRVHCGFPGYLAHGSIIGSSYRYLEKIEYRCNGGFDLIGNATRVCLENGSWSGTQPRCRGRAGFCREILAPRYGSMFISFGGERRVQASALGDTAEFVCNEGYRLKGSRFLTCTEEGFWSEDVPTCEEIPEFFSRQTGNFAKVSETMPAGCNESRTSFAVQDRENRSLASCDYRCRGRPKHPRHGLFLGEPLKYIYEYGDTIYVRCRYGYKLYGDDFFTCSGNDTWHQGNNTECRPVECVPPISPPNSYAVTASDSYSRGRRIAFKCLPGYSQRGNLQTQCDAEGRWTRIYGRCLTES